MIMYIYDNVYIYIYTYIYIYIYTSWMVQPHINGSSNGMNHEELLI